MGLRVPGRAYRLLMAVASLAWFCAAPLGEARALSLETGRHGGVWVLFARGEIVPGDALALGQWLVKDPRILEVLFVSPGGTFEEGLELGRVLRDLNRASRVPGQAVCTSACIWAFMGGVRRTVETGARMGVHMATLMNDEQSIGEVKRVLSEPSGTAIEARIRRVTAAIERAAARVVADKAAHLVQMGISLRLLAPGLKTNQSDIHWLTQKELKSFNLVTIKWIIFSI